MRLNQVRDIESFNKSGFYSKDKKEIQRNWNVVKAAQISLLNKQTKTTQQNRPSEIPDKKKLCKKGMAQIRSKLKCGMVLNKL